MSTRAVIARPSATGFVGRYHHWDGYPSGLGAALFGLWRNRYGRDSAAMLRELVDEHPAGWSTIVGADWSHAPGWGVAGAPQCYCHGQRHESGALYTERNAQASGCEWAYVIDGASMTIARAYTGDAPMVGMWGSGDPLARWEEVAVIDLAGEVPRWESVMEAKRGAG